VSHLLLIGLLQPYFCTVWENQSSKNTLSLLILNGVTKQDIWYGFSYLVYCGASLSSSVFNNSWSLLQFANGISQVKAKKWLTLRIQPVSGDPSNGESGIIVAQLHLVHLSLHWLLSSELSSSTLFTNTNKLEIKRTQFTSVWNATLGTSFGALTSMLSSSPKMLSFKLLYKAKTSAQLHGLHSGWLWDMLDVSALLLWLDGSWCCLEREQSWVSAPTLHS